MSLTFVNYLVTIAEDAQQDVAKLMSDISMIDTQINQRIVPLQQRKAALQKLLASKQKLAQIDQKKAGQQAAPEQRQGNQTATPGSSGTATPGGAQPSRT